MNEMYHIYAANLTKFGKLYRVTVTGSNAEEDFRVVQVSLAVRTVNQERPEVIFSNEIRVPVQDAVLIAEVIRVLFSDDPSAVG